MKIKQIKEYVSNQLKNYRVSDILDNFSDDEWNAMHRQITQTKPWELERRLINFAIMELDRFRYVLYTERHYQDLLIDKACIECMRCSDLSWQEKRHYDKHPQS